MKTKPIRISTTNRIILFFLALVLILAVVADFWHNRYTNKLLESVSELNDKNENSHVVEKNIHDLYKAENNFRLYVATYEKYYFLEYYSGLLKIQESISSLQKKTVHDGTYNGDSTALSKTIKKKIAINQHIADLKNIIDSSLAAALSIDSQYVTPSIPSFNHQPAIHQRSTEYVYTTEKAARKKGFIQRVKSLFSKAQDKDTIFVNNVSSTSIEQDSVIALIGSAVQQVEDFYKNYLTSQIAAKQSLNLKDKELVLLNFSLIEKLEQMLDRIRKQEIEVHEMKKQEAIGMIKSSTDRLSSINNFLLILFLLLTALICYNIYRVHLYSRKLLKARKEAEYKTIAKSNLMASVSHEIRNPLTVIRGFTELLYSTKLPQEQHDQIKTIKSASDILLSTVNDILDYSKLEAGKMLLKTAPFQPKALVEEVAGIMKSLAEKKGLLLLPETVNLPPSLLVKGDAFRLKQMLINLVSNATKFTEKGEIIISASYDEATSTHKTGVLTFEVKDSGIGIPANKIKDVFNRFEQVTSDKAGHSGSGTGLGLTICRKIVELHGGKVHVTSEVGKGSIFSVKIPFGLVTEAIGAEIVATPSATPEAPAKEQPIKKLNGKRILLVEDNPLILQLATLILSRQEALVTVSEDGDNAWHLFQHGTYDLVITDINLPGMDGIEFVRNIRRLSNQQASTPVLALTGSVLKNDIEKYKLAGFDNYIIKPFEEKDFLLALESYFTN